ncbi:Survival factor 1 [Golovinomyces cichoracearum]|uniref:Survival factor 1 n=1 Tax=Golovinomyces cichoracearum TaxID=62708 RepID=A0A420IJH2_9PEZI|nr:Survival factor 1 [Golovinomyces cichoracearum]
MMSWARQQLANMAGTPEPIYGTAALHTVGAQTDSDPYTILEKAHLEWADLDSTSVETQTFYLLADSGHVGIVQVIHSNIAGLRKTSQFNTKIFYPKSLSKSHLWSTDQLHDVGFSSDKLNFYANDCAVEISEDGKNYTIKSITNENSFVNLKISQIAPGLQVGKDGKTLYGTDPMHPWGCVRHTFWPKNSVEGSIVTTDGPIDFKGRCLFVHALHGMKPHHAAAKWNFINFQGPEVSAFLMEYTTPKSYGTTVVSVGGLIQNDEILMANSSNSVVHTKVKLDEQNGWLIPESIKVEWEGKSKNGEDIHAILEGSLGERTDRIDVMAEVPGFVKQIVAGAAGTKPYIYQYCIDSLSLKVKIGDASFTEKGHLFAEATFISA